MLEHLNAGAKWYHLALENDSPDNPEDLAIDHNQLGNIFHDVGDLEHALEHYNKSVQYKELVGNIYSVGTTRYNIAIALANNGRLSDALLYARAALRNFGSYGGRARDEEDKTKGLIDWIEGKMKG